MSANEECEALLPGDRLGSLVTPAYGALASELCNLPDVPNFLASPPPTPTSGLSETPEGPGFGRLSPDRAGRLERPNLLRPRGSNGASLGPASRDQARKVIPGPHAKGLGRNKNLPHLKQEGRGRAHETSPRIPTALRQQLKLPA